MRGGCGFRLQSSGQGPGVQGVQRFRGSRGSRDPGGSGWRGRAMEEEEEESKDGLSCGSRIQGKSGQKFSSFHRDQAAASDTADQEMYTRSKILEWIPN